MLLSRCKETQSGASHPYLSVECQFRHKLRGCVHDLSVESWFLQCSKEACFVLSTMVLGIVRFSFEILFTGPFCIQSLCNAHR